MPCSTPQVGNNLIRNGAFEAGNLPVALGGIQSGDAPCWEANALSTVATCGSIMGGNNTPDLFDQNVSPSAFTGCNQGSNAGFGIPVNFVSNNLPVRASGGRYAGMIQSEQMVNRLAQLLTNQVYILEFYAAYPQCPSQPSTGNMCIHLLDNDVTSFNSLFITSLPLSGTAANQWDQYLACIDLTNTSQFPPATLATMGRMAFKNQHGYMVFDDFSLVRVADAGPDRIVCSGGSVQIGAAPLQLGPGATVTYNWTANPAYNFGVQQNDPQPWVSPTSSTTFTLTVIITYDNGMNTCEASDQVIVDISNIAVNATATNETCPGNDGTATATVTGNNPPFTYLWSNSATTQTITGLTSGTYTVTATNAVGCTAVTSVHVFRQSINPPVIAGTITACDPLDTLYIQNYNPSWDQYYTWAVISNASPPQALNLNFINNNNSVVTVTGNNQLLAFTLIVTFNWGFCTASDTFYVQECCKPTGGVIKVNGKSSDLTGDPSGGPQFLINNDVTYFNGTLLLDGDLTIYNCQNLWFGPGAVIVNAGFSLSIINSHLSPGCRKMWKGIEIRNDTNGVSGQVFAGSNSTISGAQYAIEVYDDSQYILNDLTFHSNFVGIHIPPDPVGSSFRTFPGWIQNTSFDCFAGFGGVSPYLGQKPVPGNRSYAGIKASSVLNLEVANNLPSANITFSHLNYGINSESVNLTVNNCTFQDINDYDGYGPFNGTGIHARGGHGMFALDQQGMGNQLSDPLSFENCDYGIYSEFMQNNITANHMSNVENGVHITLAEAPFETRVNGNRITATRYGVDLRYNTSAPVLEVMHNNITMTDNPAAVNYGIYAVEQSITNELKISNNQITLLGASNGVWLENTVKSRVISNTINRQDPRVWYGIRLINCRSHRVINNFIAGIGNQGAPNVGINTRASTQGWYECNEIHNFYRGVIFESNCQGSTFRTNTMGNSFVGLHLKGSSVIISPQVDQGNRFPGPFTYLFGGQPSGAWNEGDVIVSQFFTPVQAIFTPNPNPSNVWFIQSNVTPPYCLPQSAGGGDDGLDSVDYAVAEGSMQFPEYPEEQAWSARLNLYSRLSADTSLLSVGQVYRAFYDSLAGGNVAALTAVRQMLDSVPPGITGLQAQIASQYALIAALLDSALAKDNLALSGALTPSDSALARAEADSLRDAGQVLSTGMGSLLELLDVQQSAWNAQIAAVNGSIAALTAYEDNLKEVNSIYLGTINRRNRQFTALQAASLHAIASQCHLAGGPAVFLARGLYRLVNDTTQFNDEAACSQLGLSRLAHNEPVKDNSRTIRVYPNPAADMLYVEILAKSDQAKGHTDNIKVEFALYDLAGREMIRKNLTNGGINSVDISFLGAGAYVCILKGPGNEQSRQKLMVVK